MWLIVMAGVGSLVTTGFVAVHHMHMFQLGSYQWREQFTWLGAHLSSWILQVMALAAALLALVAPIAGVIIFLIVCALVVVVARPRRDTKKPLVFTSRVNRMFITIALFAIATFVVALVVPLPWAILVVALPAIVSPLVVICVNWINAPVEFGVRQHYLRDAKRILSAHTNLIIIGITGSYGKTSVKYYLATLLKAHFNVLMTPESYNTPMGITKTIRSDLRATHEVFVCEMGARRQGEIKEDCDLVQPTMGIITAIGEQHLETFGSPEVIMATKWELADSVAGKGMLYLNGDDAKLREKESDQERWFYGLESTNGTYAHDVQVSLTGTSFSLTHRGQEYTGFRTTLIGEHTIQNLAGAMAVALDLGVSLPELRASMRKLQPAPHRLAMSRQGPLTIIDDAYNSNPAGAKAALDTLAMFPAAKILITPGMVELGSRQEALNEEFGVQAAICDHVFLVGAKQTKPIANGLLSTGYDPSKLTIVEDVREALAQAQGLTVSGDKVILLENDLPDNY
ncbi:MAG: Mur ligase family protein [Propionibacteriaceae bacterium]|nr:Mur ligase family protein [Propionibacteriaceae bacterium]